VTENETSKPEPNGTKPVPNRKSFSVTLQDCFFFFFSLSSFFFSLSLSLSLFFLSFSFQLSTKERNEHGFYLPLSQTFPGADLMAFISDSSYQQEGVFPPENVSQCLGHCGSGTLDFETRKCWNHSHVAAVAIHWWNIALGKRWIPTHGDSRKELCDCKSQIFHSPHGPPVCK